MPDHEVVQHTHVHQGQAALQGLRQQFVGARGLQHARGVVVGLMCLRFLCGVNPKAVSLTRDLVLNAGHITGR